MRPRVDVSPARRDVVTGISRDLTRPIADAMCNCGSGDSFHALWRRESARSGPFILCSHLVISISPSRAHQRPVTLPRKNGVNRGGSPEKIPPKKWEQSGRLPRFPPFFGKNGVSRELSAGVLPAQPRRLARRGSRAVLCPRGCRSAGWPAGPAEALQCEGPAALGWHAICLFWPTCGRPAL